MQLCSPESASLHLGNTITSHKMQDIHRHTLIPNKNINRTQDRKQAEKPTNRRPSDWSNRWESVSGEKLEELNLTLVIQREETPPPLTPEITPGWNVEGSSGRALHSVCGDEKQVHVCIATDKRRYPTDAGSSGLPPPPLHKTNRTVTMILTDGNQTRNSTFPSNTRHLF